MGLALAVAAYAITLSAIGIVASAAGRETRIQDVPLFEAAGDLARYSDQRLAQAVNGNPLPAPPTFAGDVVTARLAYGLGALNTVLLTLAVVFALRGRGSRLIDDLGLRRWDWSRLWLAAAVTLGAYVGFTIYSIVVRLIGVDFLIPGDSVPSTLARDGWGLAIFGFIAIVGAPVSEEFLFRGLLFGGFTRFGFFLPAIISGGFWAFVHFDTGVFIPITFIGMGFAWLFWRSGSLWDAIISHLLFNATSFILLVLRY